MHQDQDAAKMKWDTITEDNFSNVAEIYNEGIATGMATFETTIPSWETWDQSHLPYGRISVLDENGQMLGWAALSPVSSRCVYGGVAEVSVYVADVARGQGIGSLLLKTLISESEKNNIWTLQSGIFPENEASIALHQKCGFRLIGYKEKIGKLHGVWKDNVLMERRSKTIGIQ